MNTASKRSKRIFVDSSFFKAFIDENDDFHSEAENLSKRWELEKCTLITSNYILDETFTLLRVRGGLKKALKLRDILAEHSLSIQIRRVTIVDDASAWDWFVNEWKGLSFTDCTSFVLMKRVGLTRVATFDRHFSQAGFNEEK